MSWYRHPRTHAEMAKNSDPEVEGFVRGARSPRNLPDAYDDVPRCVERSWKYQRRGRKAWER